MVELLWRQSLQAYRPEVLADRPTLAYGEHGDLKIKSPQQRVYLNGRAITVERYNARAGRWVVVARY